MSVKIEVFFILEKYTNELKSELPIIGSSLYYLVYVFLIPYSCVCFSYTLFVSSFFVLLSSIL